MTVDAANSLQHAVNGLQNVVLISCMLQSGHCFQPFISSDTYSQRSMMMVKKLAVLQRTGLEIKEYLHYKKAPLDMGTGTLCTAKNPPIYGHGDTLHCQKDPYMGMGTLCTAKKTHICGLGDTLHCKKAPYIWEWGHFALPKRPLYVGVGTHCSTKKPLIYRRGNTLHCQKSPLYMGMGTHCTAKETPTCGQCKVSPCPYIGGFLAVQSVPMPKYGGLFGTAMCRPSLLPKWQPSPQPCL